VTGYRHAGNYRLEGQRLRGEIERSGTSVCVKVEMKMIGSVKDDAHNRDKWRNLTNGNLARGNEGVILYGLRSHEI